MVEGARARGLDVTTEAYPYIAGMTFINSALFNPGWQEKEGGIGYSDLVLPTLASTLPKSVSTNFTIPAPHHGADLLQYAGGAGQSDPSPAGDDRQRRPPKPSA